MADYIVKPGDSLSRIATAHGLTLARLIAANPSIADPNLIRPGQSISLPVPNAALTGSGLARDWQTAPFEYTVNSGDSMAKIAAANGVSLQALIDANRSIKDPRLIFPGQRIRIPSGTVPSASLKAQLQAAGQSASALGNAPADTAVVDCTGGAGPSGCFGTDGYLCANTATSKPIGGGAAPNPLEHGDLKQVNAIVMHRTAGSTADGALNAFKSGTGTHFLIAKDGTIMQTASLKQHTWHVGKIRSRCIAEGNCEEQDRKALEQLGFAPQAIHNREKKKAYPNRYPMNTDSIGIEVVAEYDATTGWAAPTPAQTAAIRELVDKLKACYVLGNGDIYAHDDISYKKEGEGAGLYAPDQ